MEININLSEEKIPAYVLVFITLKALFLAFMVITGAQSSFDAECISRLGYITDSYLWVPMLVFFVYFYLYRRGKMSDTGLKYATVCALISIAPRIMLLLASVYMGDNPNSWEMHLVVIELVVWALIFLYLISFWYSKFKLKEHHHHHHHISEHHHHHSSEHQHQHSSDFED